MALRYAILGKLSDQPQSGYELQKALDASVSHYWQASFQQTYGELRRLARDGLIAGQQVTRAGQAQKTVYSVTQKGEAALLRWLDSRSGMAPIRDEFLVRTSHIHRLPPDRAVARLREHRRLHEERLATYRTLESRLHQAGVTGQAVPPALLGGYLTLRCGIGYEEHMLAWCDWAIGLVERTAPVEPPRATVLAGPAAAPPRPRRRATARRRGGRRA